MKLLFIQSYYEVNLVLAVFLLLVDSLYFFTTLISSMELVHVAFGGTA